MPEKYRISELAQKAGVTNRTVHYYVGRGLLPPPDGAGVGTTYREEHLLRLLLIKRLQEHYLPLEKIREILTSLAPEDLQQALEDNKPAYNPQIIKEMVSDYNSQDETTGFTEPIDNLPISAARKGGSTYLRCELGSGLELHVPAEFMRDKPELIEKIKKYARKLMD